MAKVFKREEQQGIWYIVNSRDEYTKVGAIQANGGFEQKDGFFWFYCDGRPCAVINQECVASIFFQTPEEREAADKRWKEYLAEQSRKARKELGLSGEDDAFIARAAECTPTGIVVGKP